MNRSTLAAVLAICSFPAAPFAARAADSAPPQPGQVAPKSTQSTGQNAGTDLPRTVSAPPFTTRDKFGYRVVQSFGLRGFGGALVGAAIGQARNSPYEWGQGAGGFFTRYASGFGGNLSRQTFAFAIESVLHEDPRYFPSQDKRGDQRVFNALKQVVFCKTDNGRSSFGYGRVISAFAAGQFVDLWQPESIDSAGHGVERGFISLGGDFAYNLMQEFIPFTRPHSMRHRH